MTRCFAVSAGSAWLRSCAPSLSGCCHVRNGRACSRGRHGCSARDGRSAEPAARRFLRIAFGLLWLVDGLLQARPQMASGFGREVLAPTLADAPGWLRDGSAPLLRLFVRHPVTADAATVWIQVGLGLLLILGGTGLLSRFAIWASVIWSLLVWVVGESLGGMFSTGAGWLSGAPGAVATYVVRCAAAAGTVVVVGKRQDCLTGTPRGRCLAVGRRGPPNPALGRILVRLRRSCTVPGRRGQPTARAAAKADQRTLPTLQRRTRSSSTSLWWPRCCSSAPVCA